MNPSPGPWRWVSDEENEAHSGLFAANGNPVLDCDLAAWSDDDEALLAAAPEMREMLLKLEWMGDTNEEHDICPCCALFKVHSSGCALAALLERIR